MIFLVFLTMAGMLLLTNCEKDHGCGEVNISQSGESESHNFGANCMQCHADGGEGEGCFTAAGSVMNTGLTAHVTSGTVKFFTQPNGGGQLKYTIQIDANGNFFTTESMDLSGLYPAISGSSGTAAYMSSSPGTGKCNSCHGVSTSKLFAN